MESKKEVIHLTDLQKAYCSGIKMPCGMPTKLYFLYRFKPQKFDLVRFTQSVKRLSECHAMLRCQVMDSDFLNIEEYAEPTIEVLHCENLDPESDFEQIRKLAEDIFEAAFETGEFPLFKFAVLMTARDQVLIMLCYKGIIMDGWSYEILMRDLELLYQGKTIKSEAVFRLYRRFLEKQTESQDYKEAKEYWREQAGSFFGPPKLPLCGTPSELYNTKTYTIFRKLPNALINEFSMAAADAGVTTFALFLTLFAKTLSMYSAERNFVLNLPVSVRPPELPDISHAIGLFSDSLLFLFEDEDGTIAETASRCQMKLMELHDYAAPSTAEILKDIQKTEGENVQAPVVFTSTLGLSGGENEIFEKIFARPQTSQMWMETLLTQCGQDALVTMTCIRGLIPEETAQGIIDTFCQSVNEAAVQKNNFLQNTSLPLGRKDQEQIKEFNKTDDGEQFLNLASSVSRSFARYADRLAVAWGENTLTYAQLSEKVRSLLFFLKNRWGLRSGKDRIGILLRKGCPQIICALSAVYGNLAYMPIDPELPGGSIKDCMHKAGLKLLITESMFTERLDQEGISDYLVFGQLELEHLKQEESPAPALPEDISIIINTSGTTGTPKSICLTHQGLVNCLMHTIRIFSLDHTDRVLAVTNFTHDMAVFDTIGILICGGAVILPLPEKQKEPGHWNELMDRYKVTVWNSVPAFMEMAVISEAVGRNAAGRLRKVLLGGDWIRPSLVKKLMDALPNADLYSVGGPTETTVWNIYHKIKKEDIGKGTIPYGRPFPNTQYYILNDSLKLCPVGVTGTMYAAGKGLAAGYAGMKKETEKKFILWNGQRIYNTGDLGVLESDGNIYIKGRSDDQIKINGKRIEPSGIEQILNSFHGVRNSAVVVNARSHKLAAYYTADREIPREALANHMKSTLPEYMIPAGMTWMNHLPLARNGKIDRKSLASMELQEIKKTDFPEDRLIHRLLCFCKEILSDDNLSADMNFYLMGGDSVSSLRIISRIKEEFLVEFSISEILEYPTVEKWAEMIRQKQADCETELKKARKSVNGICMEVLGCGLKDRVCLLDSQNIVGDARKIAERLNTMAQKPVSQYDIICSPFAEDWLEWMG